MIRRPPRSTLSSSSAASDVYKRQDVDRAPFRTCAGGTTVAAVKGRRTSTTLRTVVAVLTGILRAIAANGEHAAEVAVRAVVRAVGRSAARCRSGCA